jgi:hypothetical protein
MRQYDNREYEVGKGKPPKATQFKKGHSGNPRGPRHKKKLREASFEVLAYEAVNEMVSVFINGRERRLPKKYVILLGVVNDAVTGTPSQRLKALNALRDIGAFKPAVEDDRMTPEMQQAAAHQLVAALIEEGLRNEATRHQFAEYEQPHSPGPVPFGQASL